MYQCPRRMMYAGTILSALCSGTYEAAEPLYVVSLRPRGSMCSYCVVCSYYEDYGSRIWRLSFDTVLVPLLYSIHLLLYCFVCVGVLFSIHTSTRYCTYENMCHIHTLSHYLYLHLVSHYQVSHITHYTWFMHIYMSYDCTYLMCSMWYPYIRSYGKASMAYGISTRVATSTEYTTIWVRYIYI